MKKSTLFFIVSGGCLCFLIIWLPLFMMHIRQNKQKKSYQHQPDLAALPDDKNMIHPISNITIKNITLKELEKNKDFEVIINAQECSFMELSNVVQCSDVTCTLKDHHIELAHFCTNQALIDRLEKTIFLNGNVLGKFKDLNFKGTDIYYDVSQQTLKTNKASSYEHPDFMLEAQQSFIDLKNNKIELTGGVFNEFTMPDRQQQP